MATNYTVAEAVKIIADGTDAEKIQDIGRRYPFLMRKATEVAAKAGNSFVEFMAVMPDYFSANKMNGCFKKALLGDGEDQAETSDTEDQAETSDTEDQTETSDTEDQTEAEEKPAKKSEKESAKKSGKYDGKSAIDLYKECKKRGIKAELKKPEKYYISLLEKDDAAKAKKVEKPAKPAKKEEAADDEDWGDDDTEEDQPEEKPTKKKAASAKPAKEEEAEEDDWDI